jgi:hypothetical protein
MKVTKLYIDKIMDPIEHEDKVISTATSLLGFLGLGALISTLLCQSARRFQRKQEKVCRHSAELNDT